ncbi:chemerin-like receptor 1 [Eublepharis macularius]|uniref:Chemerin-like receptor 1 n=1 Tax=Eublepharis macularius TaxID=481883 RepID=A0AA97JUJ5_EUBMA|nr:chemerin-like receptor 1 [Eublepharis macularius]
MAMSRGANGMKNTTVTTPVGVALADSTISVSPYDPDDEYWQEILRRRITLALLVIYSIIFTLGLVGNGLVILILGSYMKKTVNTIWFLNLTVANFICACSLPLRIVHSALKLHWPFGKAICKLNDSVAYLNLYASAYFLMALSVDRCVSAKSSGWAQNPQRNRIACFVASGIWVLALVLSSPRIHFRSTMPSPIDEEVTICFFIYGSTFKQTKINRLIMLISQCIFAFVIPISVTIASYVPRAKGQGPVARWSKSFTVITAVTATFYLSWLPYHVFSFLDTQLYTTSKVLIIGTPLATGLAFASTCVNPILYIVIGYDFKERPRRSTLAAFENVFGEESSSSRRMPETQAKPSTEMNSPDL